MTQEQIGEANGITPVHANGSLRSCARKGAHSDLADFDIRYL
jgi:hypothetical protein